MKNAKQYLIILSVILILGGCWWLFSTYYEGEKPVLKLSQTIDTIGQKKLVDITATDKKRGLRNIVVIISQNGEKHTLYSEDFPTKGIKEKTFNIEIDPKNLKLREGEAVINISAVDYSLRKNRSTLDIKVIIDTTPPRVYLLSSAHYINPGGSCVAIYGVSEKVVKNGVNVGDDFFPGYPINIAGKSYYIAYFAFPVDAKRESARIGIILSDSAGNESLKALPCYIRNKKFRTDNINLTDSFLERKMPEFQQLNTSLREMTLLKAFQYVNKQIREDNFDTIHSICKRSEQKQLWQGPFLRMKNAATTAGFGDRRTYYYKGKAVSKSIHMGIDLASTQHAPVEASNSGKVFFAGYIGIYGDTVIIDHGLGLFSLYAHLGMMKVKEGQMVAKGELIGYSDTSGLAGGDHLHFSMLVGGRFVDPLEWWDSHWIKDNVEKKLSLK
ncbi:MAG: M23 family metallopeptidase [Syntrophales bacterium]|nr:M23 family metallopeptidase [Syntrophales bacterium]